MPTELEMLKNIWDQNHYFHLMLFTLLLC